MPVRPLILSPPIVVRALRDDPADLLVCAGGGQRWRALPALPALRALFSMTRNGRRHVPLCPASANEQYSGAKVQL